MQHKFLALGSMTNKKGIWNIVYKASCQSLLWMFIHCLLCLNNFVFHSIFACVILCLIQATFALPFILFCFSNLNIFCNLVYSLVGRFLVYALHHLGLRCHVIYRLGWVAFLTHVQPCTYKHAMWTKRCAIKETIFLVKIIY